MNNLKQIGLAMHNYENVNGCFPFTIVNGFGYSVSPQTRVLPYLEQKPAFDALNFSLGWSDPSNLTVTAMNISSFLCPSDPAVGQVPVGWAGSNYRTNSGNSLVFNLDPTNPADPNINFQPALNGLFYWGFTCKPASITDGLSQTAMCSEHILGDFNNSVVTEAADTFLPGTYPATADQAIQQCQAINIQDLTLQGRSIIGAPWIEDYHATSSYSHVGKPNGRSCMFPPSRIMNNANSAHPGGVNLLMADGSVRFVIDSVNIVTWRAIASRNGREVVSGDSY